MTRRELVNVLCDFDLEDENEWEKEVIVVVDDTAPPYPDVYGIGEVNEDTVVLVAKVFK